MSFNYWDRIRAGLYVRRAGASTYHFQIERNDDGNWVPTDYRTVNDGKAAEPTVLEAHTNLKDAQRTCDRLLEAQRAEETRVRHEEEAKAKAERKAAHEAEIIARQESTASLYNHDVHLQLNITRDQAIGLLSRLAQEVHKNSNEGIVVSIHSRYPGHDDDGKPEVGQRVEVGFGSTNWDSARATIVDSVISKHTADSPVALTYEERKALESEAS